jgi:Glycosyl transferases group 1/FtsX-like permease family
MSSDLTRLRVYDRREHQPSYAKCFRAAVSMHCHGAFLIGYVGRLSPEKNVRRLVELERGLIEAGAGDFRFLIVGCGSEREWLERRMRRAEFTGVLRGEALARAYASLDLFVFPSQTETFGNVVLEAQASGVPCLVSSRGGPRSIIQTDADTCASGMVADTPREFLEATLRLMSQPERLNRMLEAALATAISLLIILLTTYTTVTERTRQIGILKALGASKRFIAMVFIKESMLVSAMGVAGGLLIALLARPALASGAGLKIEIEIGYTLCAAFGGLASGLMGAIYPALRAAGQDAVEALNYK